MLCLNKPKKIGEAKFLAGSQCQPCTISKSLPIKWFRRVQIQCVEDSLDVSMFNVLKCVLYYMKKNVWKLKAT